MKADQGLAKLVALLDAAGVDKEALTATDVPRAVDVMEAFSAEPFDDDDIAGDEDADILLTQYGVYDWGTGEHFEVNLTRQLTFEEDGEFGHFEHIQVTFYFDPTPESRELGAGELWSVGLSRSTFFENVRAMPPFRLGGAPKELRLVHEEV